MESCNSNNSILVVSDDKTQPQFLTDLSPNDKPWDSHKKDNGKVSKLLKSSDKVPHQNQAKRLDDCAQNLEFGFVLVSAATGELKLRLKYAWFCRVRHCPICQWRRALMWVSRFFDAFPRIYAAYPEMRYIMLTLTVKNCSVGELRATVNQMAKAWQRLSQRKSFPALGFVRSLEVTRGKDGSAHPHFHILLAVPPSYFGHSYLSKDKWAVLWQDAMRLDYKPVCDVRIVKEKPKKGQVVEGLQSESTPDPMKALMSAITETIKYTTKPSDMVKEKAWLLEMVDQMRNVRAVALGGIFKQFLSETETEQDLITASETDIEKAVTNEGGVYFGWREKVKKYAMQSKAKMRETVVARTNKKASNVPTESTNAIASDKFSREVSEVQRFDVLAHLPPEEYLAVMDYTAQQLYAEKKAAAKKAYEALGEPCENLTISNETLALSDELRVNLLKNILS